MAYTAPLWLSENDPGRSGHVEGDMCVLDSGIVVVATISSDTMALTIWAIRTNIGTGAPEVGPEAYFNKEWDWSSEPGYEALGGPSPKGMTWNDINFLSPMGGNLFGMTGQAQESYTASGELIHDGTDEYYAVAQIFQVNPATLVVTLVHHVVAHYDTYYCDEMTVGRWGNNMVLYGNQSFPGTTADRIAIVTPGGSLSYVDAPVASRSYRGGPICVSGDWAVWAADDNDTLASINLSTGSGLSEIGIGGRSTNYSWAWFGAPLSDGTIAMIVTPATAAGTNDAVQMLIIDPSPLAIVKTISVYGNARNVGWTGGWYSNVRSVDVYPDDTLIVSVVDAGMRTVRFIKVDPVSETATVVPTPPSFQWVGGNNFINQAVSLGQDQEAAIWVASRFSNYGVYYSQTAASVAAGERKRARVSMIGWN